MDLIERHRVKMAQGDPADEILTLVLAASGYLAELQNSTDPYPHFGGDCGHYPRG